MKHKKIIGLDLGGSSPLRNRESSNLESVVIEIIVAKRKWCIISLYRNEEITVELFFNELAKCLDLSLNQYENIIILGDLNINSLDKASAKYKKLANFCNIFNLENLMKLPTCFQSEDNPSSIDLILTNKKSSLCTVSLSLQVSVTITV